MRSLGRGFKNAPTTPFFEASLLPDAIKLQLCQDLLNDIGAPTFVGHVRPVDLAGLATFPIAEARLQRRFGPQAMRAVATAAGADIAVVYDSWSWPFGGLPPDWIRVRQWNTDCWVCGDQTVSFYGLSPIAARTLRQQLDAFEPSLPEGVFVIR